MPAKQSEAVSQVGIEQERDALLVQLGTQLEAVREADGVTISELARRSRLSKRTMIHMRKAQRDPRLSTLVAYARALGCRLVMTLTPEAEKP